MRDCCWALGLPQTGVPRRTDRILTMFELVPAELSIIGPWNGEREEVLKPSTASLPPPKAHLFLYRVGRVSLSIFVFCLVS